MHLRRSLLLSTLPSMLLACAPLTMGAPLDVAWLQGGELTTVRVTDTGERRDNAFDGSRKVPLGSLWKLFVYVHAVDRKLPTPDYTCTGRQAKQEVYCCEPGASIERDAALAQSCGLFFAPQRLGLQTRPWRQYWSERLGHPLAGETSWLADPAQLTPERLVTLISLLQVLASIPPASRAEAESALLRVALGARGTSVVGTLGSRLRVKTYSWHQPNNRGMRLGGAAGWMGDGTPVWFGSEGTSQTVMRQWAPHLASMLPSVPVQRDGGCVVVDFFARYPLRSVTQGGVAAKPGIINGSHTVKFVNGSSLNIVSQGELLLARNLQGTLSLTGRLGINDYVARVVDREGGATHAEAAKALAIAARTYLQQNARQSEGCQRITDSSAAQRVSPNTPTAAALAIAAWTDQLVLSGVQVRYHSDTPGTNTMAWSLALAQAQAGKRFDDILAHAYPQAELATLAGGGQQCVRLTQADAWLTRELHHWERILRLQPGYERPADKPAICRLATGMPYSEQTRNRIFVRGLATREDRITLAHEYLHLGLRNHPHGQDEALVEQLARRLVDVKLEAQ